MTERTISMCVKLRKEVSKALAHAAINRDMTKAELALKYVIKCLEDEGELKK